MRPLKTLWERLDKTGGENACWPWMTKARSRAGYGLFRLPGGRHGKVVMAHRHAYELAVGPIPKGLQVCHTCDNPPCCNPAHLWLGTSRENTLDMWEKGRAPRNAPKNPWRGGARNPATGDRNGARLHPGSVPRGDGHYARRAPQLLARGSRHGGSKLTEAAVLEIRRLYAEGRSQVSLGKQFGVTQATISLIVLGKKWAHVKEAA